MVVSTCSHASSFKKNGTDRHGIQRYKCCLCGKRWSAKNPNRLGDMRIDLRLAEMIIKCLCEGNSVRATARLTNTDPHTVIDLTVLVGNLCERYMANRIKNVPVDDVQADEIWQYIFCKQYTARLKKVCRWRRGFLLLHGD